MCICPCIRPDKVCECACPRCADMECRLRALKTVLGCPSCKSGPWGVAVSSTSAFAKAISCPDEVIPEMERAGSTEPFSIRPVRCCVLPGEIPAIPPCQRCRISDRLPLPTCKCFEALDRPVTWLKRQETVEGANSDRLVVRLRTYKGTLQELLSEVTTNAKPYLHHLWGARFIRRQFHLQCDFFDPVTEVVLLVDFASAMVSLFSSHLAQVSTSLLY